MLTSCCFANVFADPHVKKKENLVPTHYCHPASWWLFKVFVLLDARVKSRTYLLLLDQTNNLLHFNVSFGANLFTFVSLSLSTSLYKYLQITIKSTTLKILWIAKRTRDHGIIIFYRNSKPKREFLKKIKNQKKKWCDEEFGLILHQFQP